MIFFRSFSVILIGAPEETVDSRLGSRLAVTTCNSPSPPMSYRRHPRFDSRTIVANNICADTRRNGYQLTFWPVSKADGRPQDEKYKKIPIFSSRELTQ